jgi:pilus assembly protein CpaE
MNKPTLIRIPPHLPAAAGAPPLRVAVVSARAAQAEHIIDTLRELAAPTELAQLGATLQQLDWSDQARLPEVLVVACAGEAGAELAALERTAQAHPGVAFVLVCERQAPEFLLQAMRAGVREVLPAPATPAALAGAFARVRQRLGQAPLRHGVVWALTSCKGGSGATFLAANLAHALSEQGAGRVALFDLNLQFGDALLCLSPQNPAATLIDVTRNIHRLDAALLAASMVQIGPRLSVLAAPEDPGQGREVKLEHIDALVKLARQQYDYVLLDVGSKLDATAIRALDHADAIHLVLQMALPYLRDGKRLLAAYRTLGYPDTKVKLLVNRAAKGREIGLAAIESTLGMPVDQVIPNQDEAVLAAVNHGVPIARSAPGCAVAKALALWAARLAGAPRPARGAWLARLFVPARPPRREEDSDVTA